jgi:hypothetical protein
MDPQKPFSHALYYRKKNISNPLPTSWVFIYAQGCPPSSPILIQIDSLRRNIEHALSSYFLG